MNNNRGNNRRRGRGNNRQQGGGQQLNRIDSRARGNAPQLLEKYRKLALDAHLNGDRVTEEYYLQFADHYFRVIADTRQRQEDQRVRRDERWQEGGGEPYREDGEDSGEFGGEGEFGAYDQHQQGSGNGNGNNRRDREERPERPERVERAERPERTERPRREERPEQVGAGEEGQEQVAEQRSPYEPAENPFVREARPPRAPRAPRARREERRPLHEAAADEGAVVPAPVAAPAPALDPASLPPAIGVRAEVASADEVAVKPKRRTTRRKPSADDAGETLESSVS